jgi:hypothetical protein
MSHIEEEYLKTEQARGWKTLFHVSSFHIFLKINFYLFFFRNFLMNVLIKQQILLY